MSALAQQDILSSVEYLQRTGRHARDRKTSDVRRGSRQHAGSDCRDDSAHKRNAAGRFRAADAGEQWRGHRFRFTPQLGFNPSNNGDSRNPVRPSFNPAFSGPVILGGPNQYFNPNAFIVPAAGTYGNVGRDTFTGPGLSEVDLSVLKSTPVSERVNLQFRAFPPHRRRRRPRPG